MSFKLVDEAEEEFPVHRLCRVLGVSQSGYVAWKGRPACRRQRQDMVLLAHIRPAALSNGTYGSPRMTRDLCDDRLLVGRRRTARLMRENGLRARQKRRFTRTTDSQHAWPVAPNLLDQAFTAAGPDEKWRADISYIWTKEGWLCLAVVMRRPAAGLVHHADCVSQYCSVAYQAELRVNGILISMSGRGSCYDNAMVGTSFKTLKSEFVWRTAFETRADATAAIGRYIDGFYNPVRRHSALDITSPAQFERMAAT